MYERQIPSVYTKLLHIDRSGQLATILVDGRFSVENVITYQVPLFGSFS